MKRFRVFCLKKVVLVGLLSLSFAANPAFAKSAVKLERLSGQVDFSLPGPKPFVLEGNGSHLGKFTAYGEAEFVPGTEEGTFLGQGVVVFTAANGDLLVGDITFEVGNDGMGGIHASWRDSVQFSNGTIVASTGHFVNDRPPGFIISVELLFVTVILVIGIIEFRR